MSTHHVEPGGSPEVIEVAPGLTVTKFSVGSMDNNVYLVTDQAGTVLIDAAADPDRIEQVLDGRKVVTIITTHQHPDHIAALAEMAARTGARLVCGTPDAAAIAKHTGVQCETVWTGDTVPLPGGGRLEVIGLVGHTPGSITLVLSPADGPVVLFTGDSLFPGGPGKTRSPEDFASLMDDLEQRIFGAYADDTVVHPGHGDSTTLGEQRPDLGEWRTRGW